MLFKNANYEELAAEVKQNSLKIIVYGAGMIGKVIIPHIVRKYSLHQYISCYVDADKSKAGQKIEIDDWTYEIKTTEFLRQSFDNVILLITNSKFFSVVEYLDNIPELDNIYGYIIPIIQMQEADNAAPTKIERRSDIQLIPKTIHYCWFGGKELPDSLKICMESWKKYCPDYEIVRWTEENYNINRHEYTKQAYEQGKYGFVTDIARLDILYENGGIYFDTDVTLLKSMDELLYQSGFIGTEKWGNINSGGGCGFEKKHPMLKKLIEYRERFSFIKADGGLNLETNGLYETRVFMDAGMVPNNSLQFINNVTVYPSQVFHPYDYMSCNMSINEAMVSIHHFSGGWMDEADRLNRKRTQEEYAAFLKRLQR